MIRPFFATLAVASIAMAALFLAIPAEAGQPGVSVNVTPADGPDPVPDPVPAPTAQTVTIQCPEVYYENEIRTRMVTKTRMVPETFTVEEPYTVRVAKTRMVPRTVTVRCPDCVPEPVGVSSVPDCHCVPAQSVHDLQIPIRVRVGVDAAHTVQDDRCGLFARLRARRGSRGATSTE